MKLRRQDIRFATRQSPTRSVTLANFVKHSRNSNGGRALDGQLIVLLLGTLVVITILAVAASLFANMLDKPRIDPPPSPTGGFPVESSPREPQRVESIEE